MAKYIVLHKTIADPKDGWEFFGKGAPALAVAMASGKMPAKCLKTWNPYAHGRSDLIICLWEAENFKDIEAVLREAGFYKYVTANVIPVAEIDWAELAHAAK